MSSKKKRKLEKDETILQEVSEAEKIAEPLKVTYSNFENLPYPALIKIFSFLDFKDRCNAAYTCCRLYELARNSCASGASTKVDLKCKTSHELLPLLLIVPKSIILSIYCDSFDEKYSLWLPDILSRIHQRCPKVKVLIIENVSFADRFSNVCSTTDHISNSIENKWNPSKQKRTSHRNISKCQKECCSKMIHRTKYNPANRPKDLCVFSLRYARNSTWHILSQISQFLPKIKVLDLTGTTNLWPAAVPYFHKLVSLEELYLTKCPITNTDVDFLLKYLKGLKVLDMEGSSEVNDETFTILQRHGQSLEKLFLGNTHINPLFMMEQYHTLQKLKVLCLRNMLINDKFYFLLRTSNNSVSIDVSIPFEQADWIMHQNFRVKIIHAESEDPSGLCHHFKQSMDANSQKFLRCQTCLLM